MDSSKIFFIIFAIFAASVALNLATEHIVGDDKGWKLNFNYQAWAAAKDFRVGDQLVFKYQEGAHNVLRVDGTAFQQCAAPAGNDFINLTTPEQKWYICGLGTHCASGNMKLAITLLGEGESPPHSPAADPDTSVTRTDAASTYYGWIVLILGIIGLAIT